MKIDCERSAAAGAAAGSRAGSPADTAGVLDGERFRSVGGVGTRSGGHGAPSLPRGVCWIGCFLQVELCLLYGSSRLLS